MARIPRQPIQDFTLRGVPSVVGTIPVDTQQMAQFGRILMNEGLQEAAENARKEGIAAQAQVEDGTLVKRDSSFFGFFDAQFDEGAKYLYQKQKQNEIELVVGQAQLDNPYDPKAFDEAVLAEREKVFAGVPADVLPGVKFFWDNQVKNTGFAVQKDGVVRELKFKMDQFALDVDEATNEAEREMENTGELSIPIEARLKALRDRAPELGIDDAQIESMAIAAEDRIYISSKVHEYRQLPNAQEKATWMRDLMSNKGPLKDRSYTERLSIKTKIEAVDDADKATYAAGLSSLKRRLSNATATLKRGHQPEGESQLITEVTTMAAVTGDSGLLNAYQDYIETKNVVETTNQVRALSPLKVDSLVTMLSAQARSKEGISDVDSQVLTAAQKIRDDMFQVNRTGEWLDFVRENNVPLPEGFYGMTRGQQVNWLEHHYGEKRVNEDGEEELVMKANVNFFTKDQIKNLTEMYDNGTFAEKASVPKQIGEALKDSPEYMEKAFQQIAKKDVELAAIASMLNTPEDQALGLEVMEGKEFLEGEGAGFVAKETDTKNNIFAVVDEVFPYRTTATANAYSRIVMYLHAAELRKSGKPATAALSKSDARKILNRVVGGETWNMPSGARSIPLGRGLSASDNKDFWNAMNDEALMKMGGGKLPIDNRTQEYEGVEVGWERIHDEGILQPTGVGDTFYILMPPAPGQGLEHIPLMDQTTGQRLVFDGSMMPEPVLRTDSPLIESMP